MKTRVQNSLTTQDALRILVTESCNLVPSSMEKPHPVPPKRDP